jgi:hypothetical protein
MVLTWRLSVLYGILRCETLTDWFFVTELESVHCAVRNEPLYKTDIFRLTRFNRFIFLPDTEQQAECWVLTESLEQNLMYYNFL